MRLLRRPILCLLALTAVGFLWVGAAAAEKNSSYRAALESIKAGELGRHVARLADEKLEGREAGTEGGRAAGEYLAEQYAKSHLPGGGTEGYFQPFPPNYRKHLVIAAGSDPKLRDQVILVGAHYDHIGYGGGGLSLDGYGSIHPGADDNASGTAAVVELAKAWTALNGFAKRSVLFANWDGEEKGLLGSQYWVAHPTVPLDHVAAALNLDMVGRLRNNHLMIYGSRSGYGWRRLASLQNADAGLDLEFNWTLEARADHYSFFAADIPVLMLHTGMHGDYHRSSDVAGRINNQGLEQVTRLLFALVCDLANRPAVPQFRAAAAYETPESEMAALRQAPKPADRLGVSWKEDAPAAGGIRVATVAPGSAAQRAGVRPGDLIESFAGREIRRDEDFFAAVAAADSPAEMSVRRPGRRAPLKLSARLAGSPMRWGITWRVDDAEPGAVILAHVVPGSPAARAGLAAGDRIYQVGGRDFSGEEDFARRLKSLPGRASLLVERDGRLRIVTLEIQQSMPAKRAA
jgi:hypothetical protein